MTEKRFTLAYEKGNWWAVKDYDITLWKEEVIGLLNELHEENEQLKQTIDRLTLDNTKQKKVLNATKKENKQLKQDIQRYSDWADSVKRENIDKVLKMSVFEIAEAFEYYNKRIHELEKVLEE